MMLLLLAPHRFAAAAGGGTLARAARVSLSTAAPGARKLQEVEQGKGKQGSRQEHTKQGKGEEWDVVFRLPSIRYLGLISRLKIAHAGLMAASSVPAYRAYQAGTLDSLETGAAAVAIVSATGALYALSWFVRRVVGLLAVSQNKDRVRISHLTFWGRRRDVVLPMLALHPPLQGLTEDQQKAITDKLFVPLDFATQDPQAPNQVTFLLPLNHGRIHDPELVHRFLLGQPLK